MGVNVNKARKESIQRMLCQEHDSSPEPVDLNLSSPEPVDLNLSYPEPVDLSLSSFVCVQLPVHDAMGFASFHFSF